MKRALLVVLTLAASPLAAQAPVRLTLGDALRRADSSSEAVGIARAGVRGAEAQRLRAKSAWLPQLAGSATYTRTLKSQFSAFASGSESDTFPKPVDCGHFVPNPDLPIGARLDSLERGLDCTANGGGLDFSNLPFGRANNWTFGLSASQSLFNASTSGQLRAARAGKEQAEVALQAERARAVLDVATAYYDAQLAQRLLEIADSTLAQAERTFTQTRLERQVGNAAEFDLLRATVARDNQKPLVIQRRSQRDQAMLRLKQLLDFPAGAAVVLETPLGDTAAVPLPAFAQQVASAGDTTIANRAGVRAAAAGLAASEGLLGAARGARLPSLVLSSSYAKINFPDKVFNFGKFLTDWTVSVRLDVPLYTGGRVGADVMAADAARDEAALRLRQARQQAEREGVDVKLQLEAADASWLASRGTAEQAARAYDIAEVRYRSGISTLTELAEARLLLQQAEANRAQAARDLQVARVRTLLLRDLPFGAGAVAGGY